MIKKTLLLLLTVVKTIQPLENDISSQVIDPPIENGRIIGGKAATAGEFPFQALLRMVAPDFSYNSDCGATIIAPRYVLTAAHCTKFPFIDVILGSLDSEYIDEKHGVTFRVYKKNMFVHPHFDKYTFLNDIAILELPKNVKYTEYIQPAMLPKKSEVSPNTFKGQDGIVTGWGLTATDTSEIQEILRYAIVKIMDHLDCLDYYHMFNVGDGQICSQYNGTGTCNGDSGGPLIIYKNKKIPTIIGITSFGTTICTKKAPSIYTNVAYYLDWIHKITNITIE